MNRDDYITVLDRALVSPHGIRLACDDDLTARRVRAKLYRLRDEMRAEARSQRQAKPALTYDPSGKLLGVIDILTRTPPPSTSYDELRLRVWDGDLYIVRAARAPELDALPVPEASEISTQEIAELPPWPPWGGG
jgi:hypothetical protein